MWRNYSQTSFTRITKYPFLRQCCLVSMTVLPFCLNHLMWAVQTVGTKRHRDQVSIELNITFLLLSPSDDWLLTTLSGCSLLWLFTTLTGFPLLCRAGHYTGWLFTPLSCWPLHWLAFHNSGWLFTTLTGCSIHWLAVHYNNQLSLCEGQNGRYLYTWIQSAKLLG